MIDLPPLELAQRVSLTREGGLAYLPGLARTRSIDLTSCPSDLRQEVGEALRRTAPLASPDCAAQGGDQRYFHVELAFRDPASGDTASLTFDVPEAQAPDILVRLWRAQAGG
ncbi:protealysin inhibitor emfourin [Achromobacter ruhlandii]|uniref:protealysin inhibitor emfourin n=1 Tax=Achromobacter ruhlandii TaxID=72557 RepID=UPI003B9AE1BA